MRNPFNHEIFKTLACTVHKIMRASQSVTNGITTRKQYAPPTSFFEVVCIIMQFSLSVSISQYPTSFQRCYSTYQYSMSFHFVSVVVNTQRRLVIVSVLTSMYIGVFLHVRLLMKTFATVDTGKRTDVAVNHQMCIQRRRTFKGFPALGTTVDSL